VLPRYVLCTLINDYEDRRPIIDLVKDLSHSFLSSCFHIDGVSARTQIQSARWDWERLFAEASNEAVLPALYSRTRELDLHGSMPPSVLDFLSRVESLNAERTEAILFEVKLAIRLLNEIGIQPLLLKGVAYLAMGVYDIPAARYLADVDLLMTDGQIDQAAQVLMQNGFEVLENDPFARFRHHHPPLMRPGAVHFELHHRLTIKDTSILLPPREIIESSVIVDLKGVQARVPSPEHMMTHLIVHSQLQHPYDERIWPPLRAIYDLLLLQRRFGNEINWNRIEDRFRAAGHYHTFALHLMRVQDVLGFQLPFRIQLTAGLRLAWRRRQILRRFPRLRYVDPVYMFSIVIGRRLPLLFNILQTPHGLNCLRDELLKTHIYERFFEDMLKGRGH
jgi:hypothetical protein